MIGYELYIILN